MYYLYCQHKSYEICFYVTPQWIKAVTIWKSGGSFSEKFGVKKEENEEEKKGEQTEDVIFKVKEGNCQRTWSEKLKGGEEG